MMTLDKKGNFNPWCQPSYGTDAEDKKVTPPNGYDLVPIGEVILAGDIPFDVYSGWLMSKADAYNWHAEHKCHARSDGRWTTWARKNERESKQTARVRRISA